MCKVVVDNTERNADFIIYNHLFSKVNCNFTVPQLVEELQVYNLELSQEYVQAEINSFVQSGLVTQNFRSYSTCSK